MLSRAVEDEVGGQLEEVRTSQQRAEKKGCCEGREAVRYRAESVEEYWLYRWKKAHEEEGCCVQPGPPSASCAALTTQLRRHAREVLTLSRESIVVICVLPIKPLSMQHR